MNRGESSIDAVAAAAQDEALDFAGMSSPDGAVTLLIAESPDVDPGALKDVVERHDGQVVKSEGGASMCSFASAHAGLRTAIELQRALASLRIGLHAGFVIADADDFFGRNVILAARIADQAEGGEILVSSLVKELTESGGEFEFENGREVTLKGLSGTGKVYSVGWS